MLNLVYLLASDPTTDDVSYAVLRTISYTLLILMLLAAVAAIILVMLQPSNSNGIDALGGSSETFFGKNKGKSIEERMKKWTIICLVVLAVLAIALCIVYGFAW